MNDTRTCATCGKAFAAHRAESRYCSPACYRAAYDAALSRADLDAYDAQPLARGDSTHYLCPFCHDERQGRPRDNAHRKLRVWPHGAWHCIRCERKGLLRESWTPPKDADVSRVSAPPKKGRGAQQRRRAVDVNPSTTRARGTDAPPVDAEDARKRARLRRLWTAALPLTEPLAVGGVTYLQRRGIPAAAAVDARVRFAHAWGTANTFVGPAVAFPVQDAAGRLVAAEGRFVTPPAGVSKTHSVGPKSRGVFVAWPGALDVDTVTVCEGPITALSVAACGFPAVALCRQGWPAWLPRRLAFRTVLIAFDEGETKTEQAAAAFVAELAQAGARPYRLRLPAGVDVNDRLQAVGLDALRAELDAAIGAALARPA